MLLRPGINGCLFKYNSLFLCVCVLVFGVYEVLCLIRYCTNLNLLFPILGYLYLFLLRRHRSQIFLTALAPDILTVLLSYKCCVFQPAFGMQKGVFSESLKLVGHRNAGQHSEGYPIFEFFGSFILKYWVPPRDVNQL